MSRSKIPRRDRRAHTHRRAGRRGRTGRAGNSRASRKESRADARSGHRRADGARRRLRPVALLRPQVPHDRPAARRPRHRGHRRAIATRRPSTWARPAAASGRPPTRATPGSTSPTASFRVGSMGAIEVAPVRSEHHLRRHRIVEDPQQRLDRPRHVTSRPTPARRGRSSGSRDVGQIATIRVHPTNPEPRLRRRARQSVHAATSSAASIRTNDGGKTWQKVLFVSDSSGAADLELQPGNPNVIFASHVARPAQAVDDHQRRARRRHLQEHRRRRHLDQARRRPADRTVRPQQRRRSPRRQPNRIYALIEAKPGGGLYRSDDAGATWTLDERRRATSSRGRSTTPRSAPIPNNADVVFVGNEGWFKSADGGKTFRPAPAPHGDNHDIWINPRNSQYMIQSQRRRRERLARRRPHLEHAGQSADGRDLPGRASTISIRIACTARSRTTPRVIVPSLPLGDGPGRLVAHRARLRDRARSFRTARIPTSSTAAARDSSAA